MNGHDWMNWKLAWKYRYNCHNFFIATNFLVLFVNNIPVGLNKYKNLHRK